MDENEISYLVRGAIFKVYNHLGPGLLEHIYEAALTYELECLSLDVVKQAKISVTYNGVDLGIGFKADLIVNRRLIIEIKSITEFDKVHFKQLRSYLKLTGIKLGILVNFNSNDLTTSIRRVVNHL